MAYGRVEETFWHDGKIRALPEKARFLMLYLLTCRHRNRLGLFVLDPYYAAGDLQWEVPDVEEAIRELAKAGRVGFDPETETVFLANYLKHNTLENKNVVTAAIKDLNALPDTPLIALVLERLEERFHEDALHHYEKLVEAVADRVDALGECQTDTEAVWGITTVQTNGLGERCRENTPIGVMVTVTDKVKDKGSNAVKKDAEKSDDPADWMHAIWHDALGVDGHPIKLTNKRRHKYRAMYEEQLKDTPDPALAWRAVLYALTKSDHHMSERSYQMPESFLLNEERRDRWIQQAIATLNKPDREEQIRRELEEAAEQGGVW